MNISADINSEFFELIPNKGEPNYYRTLYLLMNKNNKYIGWTNNSKPKNFCYFCSAGQFLFKNELLYFLLEMLENQIEIYDLKIVKVKEIKERISDEKFEIIAGPISVIYYLHEINKFKK